MGWLGLGRFYQGKGVAVWLLSILNEGFIFSLLYFLLALRLGDSFLTYFIRPIGLILYARISTCWLMKHAHLQDVGHNLFL